MDRTRSGWWAAPWVARAGLVLVVVTWARLVHPAEDLLPQVREGIGRGVAFLASAQRPSGAFQVQVCQDATLRQCGPTTSPVATGLVLLGLQRAKGQEAVAVSQRGVAFLAGEADAAGWFYYTSRAEGLSRHELPPLGDTCLNQLALRAHGRSLASFTALVAPYRGGDGRYPFYPVTFQQRTILRSDRDARDAFIRRHGALALELLESPDPVTDTLTLACTAAEGRAPDDVLCRWVRRWLESDVAALSSSLYESPYVLLNAAARAYALGARCLEPARETLMAHLLAAQRADGSWGNPVETAWVVGVLLRVGYDGPQLTRAVNVLLRGQAEDGSWARVIAWILREPPLWFGSEEVSTGIILEALTMYVSTVDDRGDGTRTN